MEMLNNLLAPLYALGLDQTVWILLCFFIVAYIFLSQFLFKPYKRNLEYRKKNTSGAVEEATKLGFVTESLAMDYQGLMKRHNAKANDIFNQIKNEGLAQEEKLLSEARSHGNELIEKTRKQIAGDLAVAKESLRSQIPQLSSVMASRVLGRDVQ